MTVREAIEQLISLAIGYVVALLVVVAWPNSLQPTALFVLLLALGVQFAVSSAVDWFVFRRSPFRSEHRPWRYSIPFVVVMILGFVYLQPTFLGDVAPDQDAAVLWFAVAIPLLAVGWFLSNLLWALRAKPGSVPPRA